MQDRIKQSFESIKADDALKEQTMAYLKNVIDHPKPKRKQVPYYRFASAAACMLFVLCIGIFSRQMYYTPVSYVSLDVNPSIEITLNRFDRVIKTKAFNAEGESILSGLKLNNLNYNSAVKTIVESITEQGYIVESGLVSVTLSTDKSAKEVQMKTALETDVLTVVSNHHLNAQIEVVTVDSNTISEAHAEDLSPAKYLAIMKLKEVDPTASFDSCRDHTIGEIRELTGSHHDYSDDAASMDQQNQSHDNEHDDNH